MTKREYTRPDDEAIRNYIALVLERNTPALTYIVNEEHTDEIPARFCDPLMIMYKGKVYVLLVGEYRG